MPSEFLGLRTTIYKVADLEKAKVWYAEAFGAAPYFDEPLYAGFNIAGYELGLMPDETPAGAKTGNVLSYWGVENIEATVARFIEAGGEIMVASVKDPWGNVIGLIYNPDFTLP
jgi:lactoylglutathione lyase